MNDLIDWKKVKKAYDNGLTDAELAEMFNVKKNTITVKRNRAKWGKANRAKKSHKSVTKVKKMTNDTVTKNDKVTSDKSDKDKDEFLPVSAKGLNDRERLFCMTYIQSYNAIQSYINAFNCTYKVAHVNCYELLKNTSIKSYLSDLKKRQSDKLNESIESLVFKLARQANANIGDYLNFRTVKVLREKPEGGAYLDADDNPIYDYQTEIWLKDKDKMDLSLVEEIKDGRDGISVKLPDKQKAIMELIKRVDSSQMDKLKELKTEVEIKMLKAKLQNITGSDNDQMQQMQTLLDDINKQL